MQRPQQTTAFPIAGGPIAAASGGCRRAACLAIAGYKVPALVDSGAARTLMAEKTFNKLCEATNRQTLQSYAEIARPLVALTRKNVRWEWTEEHEAAFRRLQHLLLSDKVLMYPRINEPYKLYTDASAHCVGGILTQEDEDGMERVVQYVSCQLNEAQRKWATIEREAYAIVYCLKKLRPYLWGATFEILTDHKPLKALFIGEVANTRVQRWAVLIAEFGAPIRYRQGKENIRADFLSRLPPPTVDIIDTVPAVEPQADVVTWTLPLKFDSIDKGELSVKQQEEFGDCWADATDPDNEDYQIRAGSNH